MKKLITIVLFINILLFNLNVFASESYEFVWENTYVNVQRFDDLSKYTSIPKAKLKRDGVILTDTLISYNINGDWLYYLKDVDTTRIGEYKVWYKAEESKYNPGTCRNYKALVVFNVVDTKSRIELNILGDYDASLNSKVLSISIRDKRPDFIKEGYISIKYQYEYNYRVDDSKVNYSIPNLYKAKVYVTAINETYEECFYIKVIDNESPIVILKKDRIIKEKSKDINWNDYIKIEDKIEDKYSIECINLDNNLVDEVQEAKFKVIDSAGNFTIFKIEVLILDSIKPIITLSEDIITLDYNIKYTPNDFKTYLVSALDGDVDLSSSVVITSKLFDTSSVGTYGVIYSVVDDDGNNSEATLVVNLVSKIAPIIEVDNVVINVNEEVDLKKYVRVIDESDPDIKDKIQIDPMNLDITKPGTYYVKVIVTNSSDIPSHNIMKVTVVDNKLTLSPIKIFALMGIIIIIGGYSFYYYKKRKQEVVDKSNNDI